MRESADRYATVSIALHWITALLVIGQIGLIMAVDAEGPNARTFAMIHKSDGIMILLLTTVRLLWRLGHPLAPLPDETPRWQAFIARATHVLFYVLLFAFPLTGWAASSVMDRPIPIYGLFNWPLLPLEGDRETARSIMDIHRTGAKLLYVLLVLHVAGALKHHFIERNGVLHRMLPLVPRPR
ncbi:cytochrome b [Phenylobacterium sp.]|jgi:cytochrome b561|uniref:cytochrome b n=1 Tax=Phenylobacterium sp. TaxID=1871053 RepID=UPI0037839264